MRRPYTPCEAVAVAGEATTPRREEWKMAVTGEEESIDLAPNLIFVAVSLSSSSCPDPRHRPIRSTRFLAASPLPPNAIELVLAPATAKSIRERERGGGESRTRHGGRDAHCCRVTATATATSSPKQHQQSGGGRAAAVLVGKVSTDGGKGEQR